MALDESALPELLVALHAGAGIEALGTRLVSHFVSHRFTGRRSQPRGVNAYSEDDIERFLTRMPS